MKSSLSQVGIDCVLFVIFCTLEMKFQGLLSMGSMWIGLLKQWKPGGIMIFHHNLFIFWITSILRVDFLSITWGIVSLSFLIFHWSSSSSFWKRLTGYFLPPFSPFVCIQMISPKRSFSKEFVNKRAWVFILLTMLGRDNCNSSQEKEREGRERLKETGTVKGKGRGRGGENRRGIEGEKRTYIEISGCWYTQRFPALAFLD